MGGAPVAPTAPVPGPAREPPPEVLYADPVRVADPRNQSNRCTEERRDAMIVCLTLEGAQRRSCESASTRAYVTCLRAVARGGS